MRNDVWIQKLTKKLCPGADFVSWEGNWAGQGQMFRVTPEGCILKTEVIDGVNWRDLEKSDS